MRFEKFVNSGRKPGNPVLKASKFSQQQHDDSQNVKSQEMDFKTKRKSLRSKQ